MESLDPTTVFRFVDVAAIVSSGLLGGAVARAFRFDMVGFILLSVITGMGGGIIRDVLLNADFPIALTDSAYWAGALTAALLAYTIDLGARWANWLLMIVDFLGMGCWVATGTLKALNFGLHWPPAIALGIVTAVGGGALRDIMVNRIPSILGGSSLYATVAFVGAAETAIISEVFHRPNLAMAVSIASCLIFGIAARTRNWQLPEPITLKVPRPRFMSGRRSSRPLRKSGSAPGQRKAGRSVRTWEPGQPLTENLEVLTDEQIQQHRHSPKDL